MAFSGLSPQFPAVNQLNIVLPVGVPAGSAVPVQVSLGGITTTSQLNIAITASSATSVISATPLNTVLTPGSQPKSLVTYGSFAYVCGSQYIGVLDISTPGNPKLTATVGTNAFNNVSNLACYIESGNLVAFADTGSTLVSGGPSVTFFSLANPAQPQLTQQSALVKQFVGSVAHRGNYAFAVYNSISFSGSTFLGQNGDLVTIDVSNPQSPKVVYALSGNTGATLGPNSFFDVIAVDDTTIYAASSSSTGSQTTVGTGQLLVVDMSDPVNLKVVKQISIPNTRQVSTIRIQGNLAVTMNDVGGWRNPVDFNQGALLGPTSMSTLDITDPRNPVLLEHGVHSCGSGAVWRWRRPYRHSAVRLRGPSRGHAECLPGCGCADPGEPAVQRGEYSGHSAEPVGGGSELFVRADQQHRRGGLPASSISGS